MIFLETENFSYRTIILELRIERAQDLLCKFYVITLKWIIVQQQIFCHLSFPWLDQKQNLLKIKTYWRDERYHPHAESRESKEGTYSFPTKPWKSFIFIHCHKNQYGRAYRRNLLLLCKSNSKVKLVKLLYSNKYFK